MSLKMYFHDLSPREQPKIFETDNNDEQNWFVVFGLDREIERYDVKTTEK